MRSLIKIVWVILALVVAITLFKAARKHLGPILIRSSLERVISRVEPWPKEGEYSQHAWSRLLAAARRVQSAKPQLVEGALARLAEKMKSTPDQGKDWESGLFLLYCVVFDFEETRDQGNFSQFPLYVPPGRNLANWPIEWVNGKPSLVSARPETNTLFLLPVDRAFIDLRYRYKYRELERVNLR